MGKTASMQGVLGRRPSDTAIASGSRDARPLFALIVAGILAAVAAPSLAGPFDPRIGAGIVPAIVVAAAVTGFGSRVALRLPWRSLLAAALVASIAWAVALAASDGWDAISGPVARSIEYLATSETVSSPRAFVAEFTARIDAYPTHVRGHPPGIVLLLWALGRAGLDGPGWAAALMILGGGSAACAALLAAREVAGEREARRVAPFLVLMPAAVWVATSADALFMGVGSWGVALLVLASGRAGRHSDALSLAGGIVLGGAIFLTYGVVPLMAVPGIVMVARRRLRPMLLAAAGIGVVVIGFAAFGFWWVEGLFATRREYLEGAGGDRGYWFFLVANLGALALALGPAAVAGLARLRRSDLMPLVAGVLAAVALADLSGMSMGETERIWLLFVPWLMTAAGALERASAHRWLAASAVTGLSLQTLLRSPW